MRPFTGFLGVMEGPNPIVRSSCTYSSQAMYQGRKQRQPMNHRFPEQTLNFTNEKELRTTKLS